jgi:hypothetical protein
MLDLLLQTTSVPLTGSAAITDWIRAIAALLTVPVAIWGIFKLFIKDKAQDRKLSSLEKLAQSQIEANTHLKGQVRQLELTTSTLKNHSEYFAGNLNRLTELSVEMIKQTRLVAAANATMKKRLKVEIDAQKEFLEVQYTVTKQFFLSTILNLEKGLTKQVTNGREFASTVELQQLTDYTLNFSLGANEMIASNFSLEKLFRIFVVEGQGETVDKAEVFAKLVRSVEYLKVFKTLCQQELSMYSSKIESYDEDWKAAFGQVHSSYEILLREVSRTTNEKIYLDPLMREMADVVIAWMTSEPVNQKLSRNDPFYLVDLYVSPMKEVCRKYYGDPRIEEFLPNLVKCEFAVMQMKNLKSSTSKFFVRISDDLEKVLNEFLDVYAFHSLNP